MSNIMTISDVRYTNTETCSRSENPIFSGKQSLGRWCIDTSCYGVFKGTSLVSSITDNYNLKEKNIKSQNGNTSNLKMFKCPGYSYGQDVRGIASICENQKTSCPEQLLLFICDGHGGSDGHKCARDSIEILVKLILNRTQPLFKDRISKKGKFCVNNDEIKDIFKTCDETLLQYIKHDSGTTCTIKWFVKCPMTQNMYIIDIILGDSPSVEISTKDNTVTETNFTQNCDTEEAIKQWLDISYREQGSIPKRPVISRFNTSFYCPKVNWVKNDEGNDCPVYIYDQTQNSDGSWNLEKSKFVDQMYDKCPESIKSIFKKGGSQSLRDRPRFIKEYNEGKKPVYNFGNSVEGRGQNLGSFGDKSHKIKDKIHCVPNISSKVLTHSTSDIYIIGSDGTFDVNTDDNLLNACKEVGTSRDSKRIIDSVIEYSTKAARDAKWKFKGNLGSWDDQSLWVITLGAGQILKSKDEPGRHFKSNEKRRRKRAARKRHRKYK